MGDLNPASLNLQWKNEKKNKTKPNQTKQNKRSKPSTLTTVQNLT
jgi:hypothetical protein